MTKTSMAETPIWTLYPLAEAGMSVLGDILAHIMDASTVEMPPHNPLPRFIPVPIPPLPLTYIKSPRTPLPQHR